MNLVSIVKNNASYNLWANQQLVKWLSTKPSETMNREVLSSFLSLKQSFVDIWKSEIAWLIHLQELQDEHLWREVCEVCKDPSENIFPSVLKQSEKLAKYVQSLTELSLREVRHYFIPHVGDFLCPRFEVIQHCINQSTYHRGQVVTIGRSFGFVDPPMIDYLSYILMKKQKTDRTHAWYQLVDLGATGLA